MTLFYIQVITLSMCECVCSCCPDLSRNLVNLNIHIPSRAHTGTHALTHTHTHTWYILISWKVPEGDLPQSASFHCLLIHFRNLAIHENFTYEVIVVLKIE